MATQTTAYPYDTIVQITDTIGGVNYQGSGVLISPDEVLTASHVVQTTGVGTATNIVVTPGYDLGNAPFGSATGVSFHYYPINDSGNTISSAQTANDFAVIHLSRSFSVGTMGLLANFTGGAAVTAGYPAESGGTLVYTPDPVQLLSGYSVLEGVALGPGSSGGPVFVGTSSNAQVVGIVSSGDIIGIGFSAQISTATYNQIRAWVAADDAPAAPPPAVPAYTDSSVGVQGSHTQYVVANNLGAPYVQDLVPGRDGAQTLPNVDEVAFTDGVGRFDATGNAEELARLYQAAFGRGPDLSGLNDFTHLLDAKTLTLDQVAVAFIASPEYQARYGAPSAAGFVNQLYANVLGRAGDASGSAYWTGQVNAGQSRSSVLTAFSDSFEFKQDSLGTTGDRDLGEAYRLYQAALNRTPDTPGLANFTGLLDRGTSVQQVAQDVTSGPEFAASFAGLSAGGQIAKLYANALHRAADPGGLAYWTGQLQGGQSLPSIVTAFADSIENRVATAPATHDSWVFTKG